MPNPMKEHIKDYPGNNGDSDSKIIQEPPEENPAWEDPIIPGQTERPNIPANLLPRWMGDYVDALAKNTQTPTGLGVLVALSVAATCLQKRFEVSPYGDDYRESLSLWTVTTLPPGSRKTPVFNGLTKPLMDWEVKQSQNLKAEIAEIQTKIAVHTKAIERLQVDAANPKIQAAERRLLMDEICKLKADTPEELIAPRLWTSDITPETLQSLMAAHSGKMSILADEGGIFEIMGGLYSNGNANLDIFNQAYAGTPIRIDRGNRTVHIPNPALTFGLAIQPEVLQGLGRGSKKRFRGIGTLGRFIYLVPHSNIGERNVRKRAFIPEGVKRTYEDRILRLLEIPPLLNDGGIETPRILTFNEEALEAWLAFSESIEKKQGEGQEYEFIQDWTAKLPGKAARIAGICHVAEYGESSDVIGRETMEAALDLSELLITHALIAFVDEMGTDQSIEDARAVHRWIIKNKNLVFHKGDCHTKLNGRFKNVERLNVALDVLRGWNVISDSEEVKAPKKRGRPAIIYYVNPKVFIEPEEKEARDGMA
ncbi:MAG: DUF3987 domain-containing protein [Nitrospinae bacterium]|nr:DUF3987 domain-containing protein [Nitrospinota bacterium]